MFDNRKIVIATKHHKEKVIAPIIEATLNAKCFIDLSFDSDLLGTFTGEIEREEDPISTARKKCEMAMELTDTDIAIASEGSFGPHPSFYFASAADEFLVLIDKKNELEIVVRELTFDTNFNASTITSDVELLEFAETVKFPSHGIIVKKSKESLDGIIKGITDWDELNSATMDYILKYGSVYLETDMRAMFNPTRMEVIKNLTQKLADKIKSTCPECQTPGFGVTDAINGLPCSQCNFPTRSVKSHVCSCLKCSYTQEIKFPFNKEFEDPMYCDVCNP